MKTKLLTLLLLTIASTSTQAALISNAEGTLVYDDVLDITWLQNTNAGAGSSFDDGTSNSDGNMTWDSAVAWADSLIVGGFDGWRLPGFTGATTCGGFNCTDSELGHMFYNNMRASADGSILTGTNTANLALFTNLQDVVSYWSGDEFTATILPTNAWHFETSKGIQVAGNKSLQLRAWAVHSGNIAGVPEPAIFWLFTSALIGLVRFKKH